MYQNYRGEFLHGRRLGNELPAGSRSTRKPSGLATRSPLPAPGMDTAPPASMILEFTTTSVRNTTIATDDDDPYYEVVTRFWHPHITKIRKLDPASRKITTVCEIDNEAKEARIRFLDEQAASEKAEKAKADEWGEWMPTEVLLRLGPVKPGGIFIDADGVEYRWKTHNRNFQLFRCDDDTRLPIVVFHPCQRHFGVWRMSQHPRLEVKPQIKSIERLIASYILVERQRRHRRF
ncbi:hypothetical protein GGX14DRAFT_549056 [Mycena pura]|uniref:DUF6593 domain-containing protein n=1 Tax=Mycena pura TaxID=153505 RepID=A0AAD7E2G9_9AGAR|nr:hypothetical protein GGX14DRAFT_549056 [Mycena pura]